MMPAVSGETTPSIADASSGSSNRYGPERPRDVDVIGVARAARGDDRDVIEAIGAARLLASADLNFHDGILGWGADGTSAYVSPSVVM